MRLAHAKIRQNMSSVARPPADSSIGGAADDRIGGIGARSRSSFTATAAVTALKEDATHLVPVRGLCEDLQIARSLLVGSPNARAARARRVT